MLKVVTVSLGLCALATATQLQAQRVENSHVYLTATELADEVELIREAMGRPYDDSPRLPAAGIMPFELWFHVETLLVKSNRLAIELAGAEPIERTAMPQGDVEPAELLTMVEAALRQVRLVRDELGITEQIRREERDTPISTTGVFSIVIDTNRQLNILLDDEIGSEDVYRVLSRSIGYATGILAATTGNSEVPDAAIQDPRTPRGVYRWVLLSLDSAASAASKTGTNVFSLSTRRNVPDDIEPGHVYDLAQFLLADLALLARTLDATPVKLSLEDPPKHIFPRNNFRLAEILLAQVQRIDEAL